MLNKLIETGNFDRACKLINKEDILTVAHQLKEEAIMSENIAYYTFINFLNKKGNNAELHYICSVIASTGINHFKGGYPTGYFHIIKAIEIEPNNLEYKSFALLYNDIPDTLLPNDLAKKYANDILKEKPNNDLALEILKK